MIPLEEADNLDDKELSPELQTAILALVQAGNHPETASALFGVSQKNFDRWMRHAAENIEPYTHFKAEVEKARQEMLARRAKELGWPTREDDKLAP